MDVSPGFFPNIQRSVYEEHLQNKASFLLKFQLFQYGSPNEYLILGLESLCILALLKQMPIDSTIYLIFEMSIFNWLLLKIPIQIIATEFYCNN